MERLPGLTSQETSKYLSLKALQRYRIEHEQIRYFIPHGGQERALRDIAEGGFIFVSGAGNGWGKSEYLIALLAGIVYSDISSDAFNAGVFRSWPHPKRARIYSTPAELEDGGSLQIAIKKYFPSGRYEPAKGGKSYNSRFKTDTGWTIDVFSYEQQESQAAGPNIGLQLFNEPPPEPLWKEAIARARAGGIIVGGMTSLLDNPWVVDGIFNRADGKKIKVRYGDVEENCKQHGTNGHLEHDQIEKILSEYDPDERDARKTGKPLSFAGKIYKAFDHDVHVIAPTKPREDVGVYMVVDPAAGKPMSCIWAFVDGRKDITIFDEWPNYQFRGAKDPGFNVKDYTMVWKDKENGFVVQCRILDRRYGNTHHKPGEPTLKEDFYELGVDFQDSYQVDGKNEVETGIYKVREYLRYDKDKKIEALNTPRLKITSNCVNTIASLDRWARDPKTGHPKEDYKDFADCVRYLVCADPEIYSNAHWDVQVKGPAFGVRR